ncbi:MAG: hypothetical protein M3416_03765 [Acidobacteriota bacterium]|nr:hypothetical protein [Acidobacteriota bacterium]
MIYLSGTLKPKEIANRLDIGLLLGFRPGGDFNGQAKYVDRILWAADNNCFNDPAVKAEDYLTWLERMSPFRENCLFANALDVVGDAAKTWERSRDVLPEIRRLGYPAALVAQDGMEDRPVEWDAFDCLFIGGSTEWKLSGDAFWLCREAQKQGKWVHMGRVNSKRRILQARFAGCNSVDGTFLKFGPDVNLPTLEKWLDFIHKQPVLNF